MTEIKIDRLSKIEGHARLVVSTTKNEVKKAKFEVVEGARFFEGIVKGHPCAEIPITTARICGFCSQAHQITAISAVENALGIRASEQTMKLRELLQIAQVISSHALHLYFLALPDYLGFGSAIEMAPSRPDEFKRALALKHVSTELCSGIGGREIHAVTPAVGGFRQAPSKTKLQILLEALKQSKQDAVETARLFGSLDYPDFARPTEYLALKNRRYSVTGGEIVSGPCRKGGKPLKMSVKDFAKHLKEEVVARSSVKHVSLGGKTFMTGALARMNLNFFSLSDDAKSVALESDIRFPNYSPFANNFAQAVELVHFHDRSMELIEELIPTIRNEPLHALEFKEATGCAVSEAPRGVLYHEYSIDKHGIITKATVVTPTAQNLRNMEADVKAFVPGILKLPKTRIITELEKLVRAYDPCFSCAAHFLEVEFNKVKG